MLGCCVPWLSLWSLLAFQLLYTCLMQIHRNKFILFSCLQQSLISIFPPLPFHHSSNISLKARAQRLQKNICIYIYICNWIHIICIQIPKNASHIHTKIHQENTRGETVPTARNTQKSTVIATVTFFWGVYSIEETSLHTGKKPDTWAYFSVSVGINLKEFEVWNFYLKNINYSIHILSIQLSANFISFFYISCSNY